MSPGLLLVMPAAQRPCAADAVRLLTFHVAQRTTVTYVSEVEIP